jgi:DNA-binding transcriptional LysR family regulator
VALTVPNSYYISAAKETSMRALLAAVMLVGMSAPAFAEAGTSDVDRQAIEQTIRGQMNAFQRDDAAGAFAFAAPGTQHRFGDAETFLEMVRRGYPPVYRPHGVDFTKLTTEDGEVLQSVELIGPDGAPYTALYTMEHEADGQWRIVACMLIPSQRVGA